MSSALSAIRIFQGVEPDALQRLWLEAGKAEFIEGQQIFSQGEPARDALLLVEGHLEVELVGAEGRRTLGDIWPGEIVGEAGLFIVGAVRGATVRAAAPSSCLVLNRELLMRTRGNSALAALERHMLEAMARRIRETNHAIEQVWREQRAVRGRAPAPNGDPPNETNAAPPMTLRARLAAIFSRSDGGR